MVALPLSLTEAATIKALGDFLTGILDSQVEVVLGQVNRVPESVKPNFVVMTPVFRRRLSTNADDYADCAFTGSIAGTAMTVSAVQLGTLIPGRTVFGTGVAANTIIVSGPGGGGAGAYVVSKTQTLSSGQLAAGAKEVTQDTQVTVQLGVHGPNSGDNAQTISTLLRDPYAVDQMAATGVTPLYGDDPKQIPFVDGEQQVEDRWLIDCELEVAPTVAIPTQFAAVLQAVLVSIDATYPPS